MPRSTRVSNKNTTPKVYESKKVPKQQRFPHKRKIVRRPDSNDVSEKAQTKLTPGKLKRTATVGDSEDDEDTMEIEEDLGVSDGVETEGKTPPAVALKSESSATKGRKRTSDALLHDIRKEEAPVQRISKRSKKSTAHSKTPSATRVSLETELSATHEDNTASPSESEMAKDTKQRRRRQSTMTQMLDGRKPALDTPEPEYKRVRSGSRRISSGKKTAKGDQKQRTLTQMVPGLGSFNQATSDEDIESDADNEMDEPLHNDALAQRLARHAGDGIKSESISPVAASGRRKGVRVKPVASPRLQDDALLNGKESQYESLLVVRSGDDDTEDEYQPTQFIASPSLKRTRASRRSTTLQLPTPAPTEKRNRPRFGLLSTPEKRRIREIPSSQSPAESLLSTQNTLQKFNSSPLKLRSNNALSRIETPSKRKQVTFQVLDENAVPPRPKLHKFASTIPDSEDEDEELIESDFDQGTSDFGVGTQPSFTRPRSPAAGMAVGAETQAMLRSIDEACMNIQTTQTPRESSRETEERAMRVDSSFELGIAESMSPKSHGENVDPDIPPSSQPTTSHIGINHEPPDLANLAACSPASEHENRRVLQDTYPSSPMAFIAVSSDEDGEEPSLTPSINTKPNKRKRSSSPLDRSDQAPTSSRNDVLTSSSTLQPSTNPKEVTRGNEAGAGGDEEESQISNLLSAAAEQQLHSEYATYSQFRPPGPPASSMQVAHDTLFTYQETPRPPRTERTPHQHSSNPNLHSDISQATTIDEETQTQTPTRARDPPTAITDAAAVIIRSTPPPPEDHTAPAADDLPLPLSGPSTPKPAPMIKDEQQQHQENLLAIFSSSPTRPPPLVIPSSFPTPSKVLTQYQHFSSSPPLPQDQDDADNDNEAWTYNGHANTENENNSSLILTRGDGVGASGAGKGYTQWLAVMEKDEDCNEENEAELESDSESWKNFSIPAGPPVEHL
ncbi:unnamed protein product [Periconia digitata]|uniref:Uncharacterized protein n=1 Tax=Periconia digitata TaxID=1303443 RepID=A0A9W4U902_9PLEO|nr:unnamed protein product [Periconia digitata]